VLDLLHTVVDDGSFLSWDEPLVEVATDEAYAATLARARERSGLDESVLTGTGLVHGRPVALIGSEFGFLAGSIGVAAAERLVSAVERATTEGLPLLATTASGGTRMQEGTTPFLQMVKIAPLSPRIKQRVFPTRCISGIRRPAGCSPPGARSAT